MKLKKLKKKKETDYPSYEEYQKNRRSFFKRILSSALLGVSSLSLLACDTPRVYGEMPVTPEKKEQEIIRLQGKIRDTAPPKERETPKPTPKETIVPLDENDIHIRGRIRNPNLPKIPERGDTK